MTLLISELINKTEFVEKTLATPGILYIDNFMAIP